MVTRGAGQCASLKCCFSSQRFKVAVLYSFFPPKLEGALGIQWWNFPSSILLEQSTVHLKDNILKKILKYDKSLKNLIINLRECLGCIPSLATAIVLLNLFTTTSACCMCGAQWSGVLQLQAGYNTEVK